MIRVFISQPMLANKFLGEFHPDELEKTAELVENFGYNDLVFLGACFNYDREGVYFQIDVGERGLG